MDKTEDKDKKKPPKINWDELDERDENRKHLYIFGRDVAEMPCFRNSFLYGIAGGIGTGLGTFMFTSRPGFSTHIGYGTFFFTTLIYWFGCRYNYSNTKFQYSKMKTAMKQQAVFEGTAIEEEIKKKAESV
ncbi:hypothetical protein PVAND_006653 [Polypedilum vanderplanki]|uniref:Cytochrome c oxidase assembly protein COX20, mitochondrial n=1 Tax=Polypedilum vanderplanki TaxID=319348 RepID=A0A9J6C5I9_POLVA|nr:hypothetical protein PVAND_006653 [Polypedilum vanderplanki]